MNKLQKVGIFIGRETQRPLASQIQQQLAQSQVESTLMDWKSSYPLDVDVMITLGGDGTVLFVLGKFPLCPVLAINDGRIGFLTAGNTEDAFDLIQKLIVGDYIISERFTLKCQYPDGVVRAVNEVVIKGVTRLISIDLLINDHHIRCIRGDGAIVGTPTGSTAYLLSAGSPIVMPEVRCFLLSGLNEYKFTARNLVLRPDSLIKLKITTDTHETEIYLSSDGRERIPLKIGDELLIRQSAIPAKLIFMDTHYFFTNLSSRLSW